MKKLLAGILTLLMLAMAGCGGGGGGDHVAVNPPTITTYSFYKDVVNEFINGSVSYYAPDADIDSMTVVAYDSRGYEWSRTRTLINMPGIIQGSIPFSINYRLFPSDVRAYTFSIYLTDFNGLTSNQAVDIFWVP